MKMTQRKYSFRGGERLKRRKQIDLLFRTGKRISIPGFLLYYRFESNLKGTRPLLSGVVVSARNFRKAVQRNRIKRQLREALRLQKHPLEDALQQSNRVLEIFVVFTGKELPAFETVFSSCGNLLLKVQQLVDENAS